jgi:hypothetical protein
MSSKRTHKCSICGDPHFPDGVHNAQPVNNGLCCGICNVTQVIPARLQRMLQGEDPRRVDTDTTTVVEH